MTIARDDIDAILNSAESAIQAIDVALAAPDVRINKIYRRAQLALLANIAGDIRAIRATLESRQT